MPKALKRLHPKQQFDVDTLVDVTVVDPLAGELKQGDLACVCVKKLTKSESSRLMFRLKNFRAVKHQSLLFELHSGNTFPSPLTEFVAALVAFPFCMQLRLY